MINSKRKELILFVEDSSNHAFLIKRAILTAIHNLDIQCVKDGTKAVEMIIQEGFRPNLILLDIKMP